MPALPGLGGHLFGFPAGTLSCHRDSISGRKAVTLGIATDPDRLTATITPGRSSDAVTVSSPDAISALTLKVGGRKLLTAERRLNPHAIAFKVSPTTAAGLSVSATVDDRGYIATIPVLG